MEGFFVVKFESMAVNEFDLGYPTSNDCSADFDYYCQEWVSDSLEVGSMRTRSLSRLTKLSLFLGLGMMLGYFINLKLNKPIPPEIPLFLTAIPLLLAFANAERIHHNLSWNHIKEGVIGSLLGRPGY